MNDKFIGISLSGIMRRIFEPRAKIEMFENKIEELEEKLNNPEKGKEYIQEILNNTNQRIQNVKDEIEEIQKELAKLNKIAEFKKFDIEVLQDELKFKQKILANNIKDLEEYNSYLEDSNKLQDYFKKRIEAIQEEIADNQEDVEKYKNIQPKDFQIVISGTNLNKSQIDEWIAKEFLFRTYSEEIKCEIKKFVEELFDSEKIYQPRQNNKINLDSWGPYLPHSGIFTPEEFSAETKIMLQSPSAIVRNLETFRNLFPEQFPAELSANEVFKIYGYDLESSNEELLETFDELYAEVYNKKEQSIEDEVLQGNNPVSFTTKTGDDKTK